MGPLFNRLELVYVMPCDGLLPMFRLGNRVHHTLGLIQHGLLHFTYVGFCNINIIICSSVSMSLCNIAVTELEWKWV